MAMTTGILLFDDAEELDFAGPWEVLTVAAMFGEGDRVVTIAEESRPVRCAKGMRVVPDYTFADAPPLDIVLVPGGIGTRTAVDNPALIEWLRRAGERCIWVTSVCTGALLLHEAGFARGKRVTTHWSFIEEPAPAARHHRAREHALRLRRQRRHRGRVSAGIDMALWLVGQIRGVDCARQVQRWIEYDPAPPYGEDRKED